MSNAPLPSPDPASLFPLDVRDYLVDRRQEGWDIRQEGDRFIVQVNDMCQVILSPQDSGICGVRTEYASGVSSSSGRASNLLQLQTMVGRMVGTPPTASVLLKKGKPAANKVSIARLIGSSRVEALHDPYLDNKGLANLRSILELSNGAVPNLRLITRSLKSLTVDSVESFFTDLGCTAGKMQRTSDPRAHRRFFLLSGGTSIRLGASMNHLNKHEAADLIPGAEDRTFFDQQWAEARPIYPRPASKK